MWSSDFDTYKCAHTQTHAWTHKSQHAPGGRWRFTASGSSVLQHRQKMIAFAAVNFNGSSEVRFGRQVHDPAAFISYEHVRILTQVVFNSRTSVWSHYV